VTKVTAAVASSRTNARTPDPESAGISTVFTNLAL
jgi:hypothetical protein